MPGKMRSAINQFSYYVMKIRVGKSAHEKFVHFKKKLMIDYFCVFPVVGILEVGPGANASNAFFFNTVLLGSSDYFLQLNTLC